MKSDTQVLFDEVQRLKSALKPFADIARLEELHGSTVGHPDVADDTGACVLVGDRLRIGALTMADFRIARKACEAA